ncbi:type III secretion system co-regulatory protein PtrC [Pseudomonas sp. GWSMS-1]|uniref:type III secretion system co-regulatory protein PtrC n=1 Tax=Pseudomonas sp. GWSMS-1 TaxID=3308997 RepID=UPI003CE9D12E
MNSRPSLSNQSVYGVTYATVDGSGIHFESELAIQLSDGTVTTLRMPTHLSERQAIQQLVCGHQAC